MKRNPKPRKLTPAETARAERFERQKAELESQGYEVRELTIGVGFANVMGLVLGLPPVILVTVLFFLCGDVHSGTFTVDDLLLFWLVCLVCIVLHEGLHGLTWSCFSPNGWKSVQFGVIWKYLTPYCCCSEPMAVPAYVLGVLAPVLVLGILPGLAAAVTGSAFLLLLSIVMIFAGGGDLTIFLLLARFPRGGREILCLDHPYECGLVVFARPQ